LGEQILADFAALKVPVDGGQLDAALDRTAREGLSHQQFLHLLLTEQADQRRERSIARRNREARFRDKPHSAFDWEYSGPGSTGRREETVAFTFLALVFQAGQFEKFWDCAVHFHAFQFWVKICHLFRRNPRPWFSSKYLHDAGLGWWHGVFVVSSYPLNGDLTLFQIDPNPGLARRFSLGGEELIAPTAEPSEFDQLGMQSKPTFGFMRLVRWAVSRMALREVIH
jgi:hypothetical protein